MRSYAVTPNGHLQRISNDIDPVALAAYGDRLDQAEKDLVPLRARLDALNDATYEGWCPSRIVQGELDHLNDVLDKYHVRKYLETIRSDLDVAEADLASWHTLTPAARDEIWKADERAEAELAARREAEALLKQRHDAFYEACRLANVSPPRWLDNQIANWSLA
jgi:hypothetical protein